MNLENYDNARGSNLFKTKDIFFRVFPFAVKL